VFDNKFKARNIGKTYTDQGTTKTFTDGADTIDESNFTITPASSI
jgi:hypothetical protein